MIKGIKFVSIPVADQKRALAFYTEKLGFSVATNQPMGPGGQRWIELRIGGSETRISLFTPPGHESRVGSFAPISLWADDVPGTYETLRARGVEFLDPPKVETWGTSVIFLDSEGNRIHLGLELSPQVRTYAERHGLVHALHLLRSRRTRASP